MPKRQEQKHKAPKKHGASGSPRPDPLAEGAPEPAEREPPRQDGEPVRPSEPSDSH